MGRSRWETVAAEISYRPESTLAAPCRMHRDPREQDGVAFACVAVVVDSDIGIAELGASYLGVRSVDVAAAGRSS